MTKLTIVRGISGSGKSTWARSQAAVVVSRDDIRIGIFGVEYDPNVEENVTLIEHAMIAAYLKVGKDVVSDNTNIEPKFVKAIAKIGYRYGAEVELKVVDVSLAAAKKNNDHRAMMGGRHVPHEVIERQHSRFQSTKNFVLPDVPALIPYSGTPGKPKAFLVDIDGTLAHMRDLRGPFDWKRVGVDDCDATIAEIVMRLSSSWRIAGPTLTTIVMSGRDEICREQTIGWLRDWEIPFDELFMRPQGDFRADNIVKHELFNTYVRDNYDVQFVLDDRDQVVDMWRAMGLTCLQVAPGEF